MSGLTPTEAAVLAKHERGEPISSIAPALGISTARVRSIVNTFRTDGLALSDRRHRLSMELSSKALLRAINDERERLA